MIRSAWVALLCSPFFGLALASCSDPTAADDAAMPDVIPTAPLIEARPYDSYIPASYDPAVPAPLVLVLHGYGINAFVQVTLLGLFGASDEQGLLLAYPDGTVDQDGSQFWNATDGCCDAYASGVDDVAYLTAVLDDMEARYNVDQKRVYVIGHSNGGFMTHRLSCELADRIAASVSIAGAVWLDASKCPSGDVVSILQIHGDADSIVPYGGGTWHGMSPFPSAVATVATWAARNGCTGTPVEGAALDLDVVLAGAETETQAYAGCPLGSAVELWTVSGAEHAPSIDATVYAELAWTFFEAHAKP